MIGHNVVWRSTFFRCFYFARQLTALGHEVTIVTSSARRRRGILIEEVDGVRLAMMPDLLWGIGRSGWDPWNTWNRLRFLRGLEADVVHAFESRPVVIHPAVAYHRRTGAPLVIDWADWWGRGGIISERTNPLLRFGFNPIETFYEEHFRTQAQWTTTISTALARRAVDLGVPASRVTVIPAGADLDYFRPLPIPEARRRLGLPPEPPVLVFAGFVHWNLDLVLDSFRLVLDRAPDTLLTLCGPRSTVTRKWRLRNPQWSANVLERGVVRLSEMALHLAAADICLLPLPDTIANRGRWPNKVGEYMAMGKPMVTNATGDVGEMIRRTGGGVLAADSPAGFAQAIVDLLADSERRRHVGQRAREVVLEEFDYRLLTRKLVEIYDLVRG